MNIMYLHLHAHHCFPLQCRPLSCAQRAHLHRYTHINQFLKGLNHVSAHSRSTAWSLAVGLTDFSNGWVSLIALAVYILCMCMMTSAVSQVLVAKHCMQLYHVIQSYSRAKHTCLQTLDTSWKQLVCCNLQASWLKMLSTCAQLHQPTRSWA